MAIYAAEISLDKGIGNDCGMGWRHSIALQDGFDEGFGFQGFDFEHHILPGVVVFLARDISRAHSEYGGEGPK